jgi:hypothetical protein
MALTKPERQNLLGPTIVGILFGLLAAFASVAFDSEYGPYIYAKAKYSLTTISIVHALVAFSAVAGGVILLFGVLPIAVPRILSRLRSFGGGHA